MYCDTMKNTPENLRDLKNAIESYDLIDFYTCLFDLFDNELSEMEIGYYSAKFKETFDEELFPFIDEFIDTIAEEGD